MFLLNANGTLDSPKGYTIEHFYVEGSRPINHPQEFSSFTHAFKDTIRKIERKAKWASYFIRMCYLTPNNGLQNIEICTLSKRSGAYAPTIRFKYSPEYVIPLQWLPKKRNIAQKVQSMKDDLRNQYNVKQITFRSSETYTAQLAFLHKLKTYFTQMEPFIDFFAYRPINIETTRMKKADARYIFWSNTLELKIGQEDYLIHEYFHHIDFCTMYLRIHVANIDTSITLTNIGKIYEKLVAALLTTPSMKTFKEEHHHLLDEGKLKSSVQNTSEGKDYTYWTSPLEVMARFFEDMVNYQVWSSSEESKENIIPPSSLTFSFTPEEIEQHQKLMLSYIKKTANVLRKTAIS
ncbi:hypothetical protein CN918_28155 [Priestia megaterium]|nr:hypothetical protein CN918_28155 [Priestia megaterium]